MIEEHNHKRGHDIIVIGASAGGVEALTRLVAGLPGDLPAAVFVVLHVPPDVPSALASILARSGRMPVVQVKDRHSVEPGRIYVGQPNRHMVLDRGQVTLHAGPRENSARPSVDVLFRSAARAYGQRVVGVILSGTLRDGALGLTAIKMRGGISIVQDPEEALFRGMPDSALDAVDVDICATSADIPSHLIKLAEVREREPMQSWNRPESEPSDHATDEPNGQDSPKHANHASGLTCPECHGSLWELKESQSLRYECRVGHTYSLQALLTEQGEAVEAALWSAVNALQERAASFRRLHANTRPNARVDYAERAAQTEHHAQALLTLLRRLIDDDDVG